MANTLVNSTFGRDRVITGVWDSADTDVVVVAADTIHFVCTMHLYYTGSSTGVMTFQLNTYDEDVDASVDSELLNIVMGGPAHNVKTAEIRFSNGKRCNGLRVDLVETAAGAEVRYHIETTYERPLA